MSEEEVRVEFLGDTLMLSKLLAAASSSTVSNRIVSPPAVISVLASAGALGARSRLTSR